MTQKTQEVSQVQIMDITVGANALRALEDDEGIDQLAASIRRIGVLVPLVCRLEGDVLHLVAGHRRIKAATNAGLETVPVIVGDFSVAQAKEIAFAENMFREDLSAVEIAAGIKDIIDQEIMTIEELAKRVNRSTDWIGRMIAMLAWPDDVLGAVHGGWLSVSAANNLACVTEDTYRDFLLTNAHESGATARTTAAWLQAWRAYQPPEAAVQAEPVPGQVNLMPAVPQAPCLCCGAVYRTDELCHMPVCTSCIKIVRDVGSTQR